MGTLVISWTLYASRLAPRCDAIMHASINEGFATRREASTQDCGIGLIWILARVGERAPEAALAKLTASHTRGLGENNSVQTAVCSGPTEHGFEEESSSSCLLDRDRQ